MKKDKFSLAANDKRPRPPRLSLIVALMVLFARLLLGGSSARGQAPPAAELILEAPVTLTQADSGPPLCFFSRWPNTVANLQIIIDLQTKEVQALLDGAGQGLRQDLSCAGTTRDLRWDAIYDAEEITGQLDAEGKFTLLGSDMFFIEGEWSWENCRENGAAVACPAGEEFEGSYDITISGQIDLLAETGSGLIQVNTDFTPTSGSWSASSPVWSQLLPVIRAP